MALLPHYRGRKVAVFGLGETGISTVCSLVQSGARVLAWDDDKCVLRKNRELCAGCEFVHPYEYRWDEISELVLSPGVPHSRCNESWVVKLAKRAGCHITSDVEIFCRSRPARLIGVTGTNGKSTTVELIGWILNRAGIDSETGGNIGKGVLSLPQGKAAYILELSSYQLELMRGVNLDVGVILNITPNHLDVYSNMADYIAAKGRILEFSNLLVANCGDSNTAHLCESVGNMVEFSCEKKLARGVSVLDGRIYFQGRVAEIGGLKIDSASNAENIAASYAVAKSLGVSDEVIMASIREFPGLRHRNQVVAEIANVTFVNDSKATTAASVAKALVSRENVYWIAGGKSKDGGIEPILSLYANRIRKAFLVGEAADMFAVSLQRARVEHVMCYDVYNAVQIAFTEAIASGTKATVLLSPACSSLDQWKNFEERGDAFCAAVAELAAPHKLCSTTTQ
ncbi:UDP-N-acetylmuramoyl-L-alanine--D-glutamate ligase [Anaplasma marginale]|uniref:UDP-N-acetylmuramoylalanine--D-glutamate ligase n=1 Tax=Anaplasma marginale TaxID=770 RepID=A0A643CLL1_ANAMA|nr:UDP-N-acetylmuramoyl-L-alanine--D-glutamate ligase [Anaplasma marginale]AXW84744.1 UDP-N-acetylmuramoyl-L-alanine--D-glutamate ligase [Anaplasma marginale]KAA8473636.1 UDP-N-acetylmuramoyl-L-alanine--D-glutamate ligase [Anaplasma marginale]KAB0451194.1 UDP-N-acetylmuramoyl-L-alanine--D-glutamate ligase [Anaplasma marginale]